MTNPLLAPWTGLIAGGVPPFDQVKVEHFVPAFEVAMAEKSAEIAAIASNKEDPTFENTVEAFDRAGKLLERVNIVYSVWSNSLSTPEFRAVKREIAPRLAEFFDSVFQNTTLFQRIETVFQSSNAEASHDGMPSSDVRDNLTPEQRRMLWLIRTYFVK
jgi:peptidyl-dipeptidase Dcp